MTIQLATSTRNAMLDAIETDAGTSAIIKIRTGAQPANCAAADAGTVLATLVTLRGNDLKSALETGQVDAHPDAVAYARSLKA